MPVCFLAAGNRNRGISKVSFSAPSNGRNESGSTELTHKNRVTDWHVPTSKRRLAFLTLTDLVGLNIKHIFFLIHLIKPASLWDVLGPFMMIGSAWAFVIKYGAYWVPMMWYGALITTFWCSFRWRILSEHVGEAYDQSTHRVIGSRLQKALFLVHNTDHHWEHHLWPTIPFWNLPKRG